MLDPTTDTPPPKTFFISIFPSIYFPSLSIFTATHHHHLCTALK
jgi:hypothetical protein